MEHRTRIRCLALALLLTAASPATRAQTAPGLTDFQAGRVAEAVSAWNASATAGDATAALYLGVMYDTGFGVPADRDQAMRWYRAAADAGNPTAMFNLAVLYDGHRPSGAGPDQAIPWYLKAAQNGVGRADYNLGLIYEGGDGVPVDRARAITFYTAAARHGVPAATLHLARLGRPYTGPVQRRAEDPALTAFQQAQQLLLTRGTAEAASAVALFREAARTGNPLAEYNLGYCYEHGLGVPLDVSQAVTWYRRASTHAPSDNLRTISEASARKLSDQISHARR